jgi:hypothetical protein
MPKFKYSQDAMYIATHRNEALKHRENIFMKRALTLSSFVMSFLVLLVPALGHQPFFEDKEFTSEYPGHVKDPTISTAMYATLETPNDVDYYSFNGSKGQSILLSVKLLDPGQSIHRAQSRRCSGRPDKWADGGQRPSSHAGFGYSIVVDKHCDNGLFLGKIE